MITRTTNPPPARAPRAKPKRQPIRAIAAEHAELRRQLARMARLEQENASLRAALARTVLADIARREGAKSKPARGQP